VLGPIFEWGTLCWDGYYGAECLERYASVELAVPADIRVMIVVLKPIIVCEAVC